MVRDAAPETELATRIENLIGARPSDWVRVERGYTPTARWVVRSGRRSWFVKVATHALTATFLREESRAYDAIRGDFIPERIAWEDHEREPILVLEDLSAHDWPPPWSSRRVDQVLLQIEAMHGTRAELRPYAEVHGQRSSSWKAVAADPMPFLGLGLASARWLEHSLDVLIEHEEKCVVEGDALTHLDIRSDNICLRGERAVLIDWNHACLSNPELDLGFWLPSLAHEGGPEPEAILPDAPHVAAWVAGFFAARAGLPIIPHAPRVRQVQLEQLETALPWAARALELPVPASF